MTRKALSCTLLLLLAVSAMAQVPVAHNGLPALKFRHQEGKHAVAYFVEYLQYQNQPAFRIRAHHYHAWCNGYLYITPEAITWDPSLTPDRRDGIVIRRTDLTSFTPRFAGYEFAVPGKVYKLAFLSEPDEALSPREPDQRLEMLKFLALAHDNFAAAQERFLAALSSTLPADAKPAIRILEPAGATMNATLDASAPVQTVIGLVRTTGGAGQVQVNGTPAEVKPLAEGLAWFQSRPLLLPAGMSDVVIEALGTDGNRNSMSFRVGKPEVRITAPAPGSKTRDEKVTVQGMVLGMRNLQRVNLAGKQVPVTPRQDGAFDFRAPDLPLAIGPNRITGFTTQANGQRLTFDVAVIRYPPVAPLTQAAIENALKNAVSPVRIEALVGERGVDFELTPELSKRLRSAGASQSLLDAIADAYAPQTAK